MFLRFREVVILTAAVFLAACAAVPKAGVTEKHYLEPGPGPHVPPSTTALRVCADPNNLPFSNKKGEGFENKIASLLASEMNVPVEYTWWAQRRGFFRNTLRAGTCDVVLGVPNGSERADTSRPYYRSSYVFVMRSDRDLNIHSFDDPRLRDLKIGVQVIGDDGQNPPPLIALSERGIVNNLKGYTVYGDYSRENPPARIIDAVADGEVDVAIVWGPLAGFFAEKSTVPLSVAPVEPDADPNLPFSYDISIGVRQGEDEFRARLEDILSRKRTEVEQILTHFHVPHSAPAAERITNIEEDVK
jgi:mxaJ protein